MSDKLDMTIHNELAELKWLDRAVNAFFNKHRIPPTIRYSANLAIEEMITNIIKYGYDDKAAHKIHVAITTDGTTVAIRIEDDGHEFDPLRAPAPDTAMPLEHRRPGGLGIHLVRNTMDSMEYHRMDGRNVLDMRLNL